MSGLTGKPFQGRVEPEHASAFNATQLQVMIRLYERIQGHVFRLMSTDSVPKASCVILWLFGLLTVYFLQFIKTPVFLSLRSWVEEFDPLDGDFPTQSPSPTLPPGLNDTAEEVGGAYVTISQQASERAQPGSEHKL
jgi:hypothetical protein